jgi:hypothetical protein
MMMMMMMMMICHINFNLEMIKAGISCLDQEALSATTQ